MNLSKENTTDQEEKYFIYFSYRIDQNLMTGIFKFGMQKTPFSPLIVWFMVEKNNALSSVSQPLENETKQKLWLGK